MKEEEQENQHEWEEKEVSVKNIRCGYVATRQTGTEKMDCTEEVAKGR